MILLSLHWLSFQPPHPPLLGYCLMLLKLTSLTEVNKSSCNCVVSTICCPCQACLYLAYPVVLTRCTDTLKGFLKSLCPLTTDRRPTKNNPPSAIRMLRINVKAFLTADKAMLPEVEGCRSGSPQSFFCRCLQNLLMRSTYSGVSWCATWMCTWIRSLYDKAPRNVFLPTVYLQDLHGGHQISVYLIQW